MTAPYISAETKTVELTFRCILIAIFLTIILALSNAFLALKIGMLTSASIPAAVISMAILRFFKDSSVLENNLVQTAASAGEAVAGGIVYTIPALIMIHYWYGFSYIENFCIAAIGGTLGVIFSIPLRKILVHQKALPFPEGKAIAEVLKTSSSGGSVKELLIGGILGGILELCQTGLKVIANNFQVWFSVKRTIVGFGVGFSATMIGAGFLVGIELGLSIFIGAILGWVITVPVLSEYYPYYLQQFSPMDAANILWNEKVRYLGIGAMLFAGLWSLLLMFKPLGQSIKASFQKSSLFSKAQKEIIRTEYDIPILYLLMSCSLLAAFTYVFFQVILPLEQLGLPGAWSGTMVFFFVFYVLIIGFIFSVITAYFSGLVGVTASPGSSVIIAGMLLLGWILSVILRKSTGLILTHEQIQSAEAITIIIGSVVTGIAAIANDNIQDLKVGHILGATPWKQQVMLLLGVLVAAMVIPPVMQLLFDVYGIAGVTPHAGMDPSQTLPAPPAALMAAITQGIFNHGLPWGLLATGALLMALLLPIQKAIKHKLNFNLSLLGIAIGIYLPMSSSIPLFIGALLSFYINRSLIVKTEVEQVKAKHKALLMACGLVAGAALMDVFLAIPFSLAKNPNILQLDRLIWDGSPLGFAILSTIGLCWYIKRKICCL